MKRCLLFSTITAILLCMFGSSSIAESMSALSISVDKPTVTVKNGDSVTVTVHVDVPDGGSSAISGYYDNKYICTASIGEHFGNSTELTITGTGMGVSTITVCIEDHPEVTVDITVNVTMSSEEKKMIDSVKYLSDRSFFYYDNEDQFVLLFALKDENETRIAAPSEVKVRIENDEGVIVYEDTHYLTPHDFSTWTSVLHGERYLASVRIDPEKITESNSSSGTVYFTVTNGYIYFEESEVSASELPKVNKAALCSLDTSPVPTEISYSSSSGRLYSKVNITELSYEFSESYDGSVSLTLFFTGQKTYDYEGDNKSSSCKIGWKLYDEEGFVVKTGTCYTSSLEAGEKFKKCEETIYSLEPGAYSLKLVNVE